ncbi:hypothetical protein HQ531_03590 [bacterium]|nr:hypothetical protein [bacterium]
MWSSIFKATVFVFPWAKKGLKYFLKKQLEKNQQKIVARINEEIDIPKRTEAQEEALFSQIYDALQAVIEKEWLD